MSVPSWAQSHSKPKSDSTDGFVAYSNTTPHVARPFKPHGTFKSLEEKGTLHIAENYNQKKNNAPARRGKMPGYTGYIRSRQHIFGRSYGAITRLSESHGPKEVVLDPPIPRGPQYETPTPLSARKRMVNDAKQQAYHVPGFSSHTSHKKDRQMNLKLKNLKQIKHGALVKSRYQNKLSSNPVPGQTNYMSPRKMIPANLKGIRYTSK